MLDRWWPAMVPDKPHTALRDDGGRSATRSASRATASTARTPSCTTRSARTRASPHRRARLGDPRRHRRRAAPAGAPPLPLAGPGAARRRRHRRAGAAAVQRRRRPRRPAPRRARSGLLRERRRRRSLLHPRGRRRRCARRSATSPSRRTTTSSSPRGSCTASSLTSGAQYWLSIECAARLRAAPTMAQRGRPAAHGRAVQPPRLPPPASSPGPRDEGLRDLVVKTRRRLSRLPPPPRAARRRRVGRRRLPVGLPHPALPPARRPDAPAADRARDVCDARRPYLQLRAAPARLPPGRHPLPLPALARSTATSSSSTAGGDFTSRRGVGVGSISHHPAGVIHGPHPGAYEESIGARATYELAVMLDTYAPLRATEAALSVEDPAYHASFG